LSGKKEAEQEGGNEELKGARLTLACPEIAGRTNYHRPDLQIQGRHGPPIEELGGKATFFIGDFKKYCWALSTRPQRGGNPDDNQKPGTRNHGLFFG